MSNIVKNKDYLKTHDLFKKLNNYINPNREYNNETKLLKEFLEPLTNENFETNNYKLFKDDGGTDKYDIDNTFVDLIKQAILCKIHNIKIPPENFPDITDNTSGLFKFVTTRDFSDNEGKGTVIHDHEKIKNILASLDVINTIIDVYDAYANFIKEHPETYAIENFNDIIIVHADDKKEGIKISDEGNSGYYIKKDADQADITIGTGVKRINKSTLFLAIKSFNSKFLEKYRKIHDLTGTTTDYTKYGVDYTDESTVAPSTGSCSSNSNCVNGQVCNAESTCVNRDGVCSSDAQCGDSQKCSAAGNCASPGGACSISDDCINSQICTGSTCADPISDGSGSGGACVDDDDCSAAGETCNSGTCGAAVVQPFALYENTGNNLFNAAGSLIADGVKINIHGIYLKKVIDGANNGDYEIVDKPGTHYQTQPQYDPLKNDNYKTKDVTDYTKRNQVIFKEFINYMCKLENKDKYNGVYAVLNLLRMCKVYINLAITNCNIMFNRVFVKDKTDSVSDLTYAKTRTYDADKANYKHEGFVFKYISNTVIRNICNAANNGIYGSGPGSDDTKQYFKSGTDGIASIERSAPSGGVNSYTTGITTAVGKTQMLNNSYYGSAHLENKRFYSEIIKILNKLKYELSESISILNEEIDITEPSNYGFEANVINQNTIRIKRRNELVNKFCVESLAANCIEANVGPIDKATTPDGGTTPTPTPTRSSVPDNESFSLEKILEKLNDADIAEAFINNNVNTISRFYYIKIDNKPYLIVDINKTPGGYLEFDIRARLAYTDYDNYYNENIDQVAAPLLDISSNVKLFTSNMVNGVKTYTASASDTKTFSDYNTALTGHILFYNSVTNNKVTLSKKDAYDYNNTYIENIRAIRKSNSNINTNESKIKNYETIYNTYKSRYDFMHNQFIAYSTILAILAVALIVGSVSSNNLATTKLITLICFGIIILIFVTYYVFNILYVNEHFTNKKKVEKFEVGAYKLEDIVPFPVVSSDNNHLEFQYTAQSGNFMYQKSNFVQNQIDAINNRIIQNFELLNVGIRQNDSNYAFGNLMNISTNERIARHKINTILDNKKVNTTTHIDLLKYEIAVYRVKINTLLYSALVIIGLITINLYTEGEYYGNLIFIGTLFGIIILTYYLTYSNHIVRTESKNFYWGKEFEASFE